MVFLPADGPSESEVCQAVSPRLPELELIIVKGADGRYGCTGDDVPIRDPGRDDDLRGLAYEIRLNAALRFVADPVAKAQAAALVHDSMVTNGRLEPQERAVRTPWAQVAGTLLIVAVVLAGILRVRRTRRQEQEQLRDELDDVLAELALAVVEATPADPRDAGPDPDRAAGYVDLLTRARSADGGWAGLLRQARELLTQKGVRP
jgi:type IV secretory pathway VirJ component